MVATEVATSVAATSDMYSFSTYPFEFINILIVVLLATFFFEGILSLFSFGETIGAKVYRGRVANSMAVAWSCAIVSLLVLSADVITEGTSASEEYLTAACWIACIWMVWDLLYRFTGLVSMHFLRNFVVLAFIQMNMAAYTETSNVIYAKFLWFGALAIACDVLTNIVALLGSFRMWTPLANTLMYASLMKCASFFIWGWVLYADFQSAETSSWKTMMLAFLASFNLFIFLTQSFTCFNWLLFGLSVDDDDSVADTNDRYRHPMETCSAGSQMALCWMEPMLWLGSRRPLQIDDVFDLPYASRSGAINKKFDQAWNAELERVNLKRQQDPQGDHEPSLCNVLLRAFSKYRFIAPFQALAILALVTTPILVYQLLLRIEGENKNAEAYAEAVGLWLSLVLSAFSTGQAFHYCNHMAVNIESACMNAVYRKLFLLSTSSLQASGSSMVNMLSGDSQRVYMMFFCLAHLTNVIGTFVSVALLFWYVGYAAFTALIILLLVVPFQFWLGHNMHFIRADMVSCTDKRVQQTSEFLAGVRLIKMQGWENTFKRKILDKRDEELKHLWRLFRFRITNSMATFTLPTATTTFVFIVYNQVFGHDLEIATTFATLAVLSIMRPGFFLLPIVLISAAEGSVAIKRFQKFLTLENMKVARYTEGDNAIAESLMDSQVFVQTGRQHGGLVGGGRGYSVEIIEDPSLDVDTTAASWCGPSHNSGAIESIAYDAKIPAVEIKDGVFEYWEASSLQDIVKEAAGGGVGPPQGNVNDDVDEATTQLLETEIRPKEPETPDFKDSTLRLTNVDIKINQGDLVCIVGQVGAGKSSLVHAMLGELHQRAGSRALNGRVSYVGQDVWIINDTYRKNILFNLPFDETLYYSVLQASQLLPDLRIMPAGDMTVVGERGVTMSGGQKARLSLARCLYRAQHSDTFILDDVLAALDMQTLKAVLEEGVNTLLAGKTRILVVNSNYYEILQNSDQIIVMQNGDFAGKGTYAELKDKFPIELCVENEEKKAPAPTPALEDASAPAPTAAPADEDEDDVKKPTKSVFPVASIDEGMDDDTKDMDLVKKNNVAAALAGMAGDMSAAARASKGKLQNDENRVVGILDFQLYHDYFNAAWNINGTFIFCFINFIIMLAQIGSVMSDVWLADWADASDDGDLSDAANLTYIYYFLMILGCVFVLAFSKACFFMCTAWRSGKRLHERALDKLVKAPVHEYFDVVPSGRILNRFSKDLDAVDLLLVDFLFEFLETAWFIFCLLAVCAYSVPEMLIIFFPMVFLFYKVRQMFSRSSREMKRIESTSRSPVFSTFGETVTGLAHIRAYGEEEAFRKEYCDRLDTHLKITFHLNQITPWNIIRLDLVGSVVVLTIAVCVVLFEGTLSETLSALALAYSVQLESRLTEAVWKSIETENYMTQMERLEHFQNIPQETQEGSDPPASWPAHGLVEFRQVVFRYRPDLPEVLKKVNFIAAPTEQIGVCGRTGSGKSSLMVCLFRLGDLKSGHIFIDGLDISHLKLQALRDRISIIPQMPWLFRGTVRQNVDPSLTKDDADIWAALRHAHLEDWVRNQPDGLNTLIVERGANLSQGQRQLLCIARALVRKSKVVMLDEATANIDSATDELVQRTIRENFTNMTSLTIAHRLSTIADSDRILVLSHGEVVECDTPLKLLKNGTSTVGFKALCEQLAADSLDQIEAIAQHKAEHGGTMLDVAVRQQIAA